eukprot:scaffold1897_cov236-Chaetoceros_neogracile.AAC.5
MKQQSKSFGIMFNRSLQTTALLAKRLGSFSYPSRGRFEVRKAFLMMLLNRGAHGHNDDDDDS